MSSGILAGILWGLDTVILGVALSMSTFVSSEQAAILAPFVSTFIHDFCSSIWMLIYMGIKKQYRNIIRAVKTRSGKFIILGDLLGGPVGMSGYVAAINYIGPAYTAIISSMFPALGAFLSYVFLKEKMRPVQLCGLAVSILGVIVMGYTPGGAAQMKNIVLGFGCAILCCIGWASEAVICAYGLKDPDVTDEQALQIRQMASAVFYGGVILTVIRGWGFTIEVVQTSSVAVILASAFFGTALYVFYYRAIAGIGASKAMALNITYSAWAIVFAFLLLHTLPDLKSVVCGVVIVAGALVAAVDLTEWKGEEC